MKQEDIELWDWHRILIGDAPLWFMLEVVIRTMVMLILLIVVMRLAGKKISAGAGTLEISLVIILGTIVSLPMQDPFSGILPGILILGCLPLMNQAHRRLNIKFRKAEALTTGEASLIVKDGIIYLKGLKDAGVSHEQLFTALRTRKIRSLGEIKRTYLEATGDLSIIREPVPKPGLSVLPGADTELTEKPGIISDFHSCINCGFTRDKVEKEMKCPVCGSVEWKSSFSVKS